VTTTREVEAKRTERRRRGARAIPYPDGPPCAAPRCQQLMTKSAAAGGHTVHPTCEPGFPALLALLEAR
jgi:hypothetical protein